MLSPVVKDFPSRVYVPNTESDTVSVIDPKTYKVIETIPVGRAAPARRALLGPEDAVGQQRQGQHPHPDRPRDRQGGQAGRRRTTRTTCTSRRTASTPSSWPPSTASSSSATPHTMKRVRTEPVQLLRRQPRRLLARRPLLHRLLRVQRRTAQGRHRADEGGRPAEAPVPRRHAAGREDLARRQPLLHRRHEGGRHVGPGRRHLHHAHASCPPARAPRPLRQPRLPRDVHLQPGRGHRLRLRLRQRAS